MTEEIAPGLYRVEIPLPDDLLKSVNSYIIRGRPRNLIVDTGWYHEDSLKAMRRVLKNLAVDLDRTDFFITHHHIDHIGLVFLLNNVKSAIYLAEPEARRVRYVGSGSLFTEIGQFLRLSGFPDQNVDHVLSPEVTQWYGEKTSLQLTHLSDGAGINIGDYRFTCVAVPGHSPGHMCLYESEKRLLIAGDHLLGDITPSIQGRLDGSNPLKEYLASLERTRRLDIDRVLPGHRSAFRNHEGRIREIEEHHRQRNDEVLSILRGGDKTAYQTASEMNWNTGCDSWESFPVLHSFFATGEASAHLAYLEYRGDVRREMKGPLAVYSLAR